MQQSAIKPNLEQYPFARLPEAVAKLKAGKVAGRCIVHFD
jgi:D-arabinose 1-dehydrogenase-like Zn-dependent alcohol dehydrogenase